MFTFGLSRHLCKGWTNEYDPKQGILGNTRTEPESNFVFLYAYVCIYAWIDIYKHMYNYEYMCVCLL